MIYGTKRSDILLKTWKHGHLCLMVATFPLLFYCFDTITKKENFTPFECECLPRPFFAILLRHSSSFSFIADTSVYPKISGLSR